MPRTRELLALFCLLLTTATAAAQQEALSLNGGFEKLERGWPEGWSRGEPGKVALQSEGGDHFVRFSLPQQGTAMINRRIKLDPTWVALDLAMDVRARGLKVGEQGWMTGRLEYLFHNDKGERVGGWPWLGLKQEGNTDWTRLREDYVAIPEGATELSLTLGVWNATGVVDIDDLTITPHVDPARLAVNVDPHRKNAFDNGDFRQGPSRAELPGWSGFDPATMTVTQVDLPEGAGSGPALRIERGQRGTSALTQTVHIHPWWEQMDIGFWVRTREGFEKGDDWRDGAQMRYRFRDAQGKVLEDKQFGGVNTQWRRHRHDQKGVPAGAVMLEVTVGVIGSAGTVEVAEVWARPTRVAERKAGQLPAEVEREWSSLEPMPVSDTRSRIELNGTWQFLPGRADAAREPTDDWGLISVPGNWHKDVRAKGLTEAWIGFKPDQANKAWYQRTVTVPADWQGQQVVLDFDRVSTDALVWVNGEEVGEFNWPAGTLDVTNALKFGEPNTIRVMVLAMNDREEVVHYMGYVDEPKGKADLQSRGITGDVTLLARPAGAHIIGVNVRPSVRDQMLRVDVELQGVRQTGEVTFRAVMQDEAGSVETTLTGDANVEPLDYQVVTIELPWSSPRLWDYRRPNMYTMVLDASGAGLQDQIVQAFGFREFWIDGRDFYMNGTKIRLRPGNLQYGAMPEHLIGQNMNFGHHWPEDQVRRGNLSDYDLKSIEQADKIGLLVDANVAHMRWHVDRWDTPAARNEYRRIVEHQVRKYRNHPSVVMYTHSANAFQWQGDGDPWDIGMSEISSLQEYDVRYHRVLEAIDMVKSLDPKPVYAHFGTYNGDVYTSNMYLNFIPLQEREEWLSRWTQEGQLPYMSIEMGPPLYSSVMRGRDGYTHQGHSEPLPTEWTAVYFGEDAYAMEQPEFRQLLHERFKGGNIQREYDPHIRHDGKERLIAEKTGFRNVLDLFILNTWRSWRTMGVSGGMIPWHHEQEPALKHVNGPSLAWIAGAGGVPDQEVAQEQTFTSKTHHFSPGERLEKQIVLINDYREPADYTARYEVVIADRVIAGEERSGTLDVAQMLFEPVSVELPTSVSTKQRGEIRLTARIGEQSHEHALSFDILPALPKAAVTVSIYDPQGETRAYLESLGVTIIPWTDGQPTTSVAVVGRHALSSGGQIPGDLDAFVRDGGRLLVMGQHPQWTQHALHLRTAPHLSRRVFPVDGTHPVLAGLDQQNLANWNGSSTLVQGYPSFPGYEWVPPYGWHWGNRHAVSSTPVEKPHRTSWRPILQSEFDLAYTPLMEMDYGAGRITLCTLDLEGRTQRDPAAETLTVQLMRHVAEAPLPGKAQRVVYLGGAEGRKTLDDLGVIYEPADSLEGADLAIVGPEARIEDRTLAGYLRGGGKALVLRRTGGQPLLNVSVEKKSDFFGAAGGQTPDWPEAKGLSLSDLRWRSTSDAWLLKDVGSSQAPLQLSAGGQLGRKQIGSGVAIFAQVGSDAVPADEKRFFRYTRWRQTRALSQLLANLGAAFEQDARMVALLKTPDHFIDLAGADWHAALVNPKPESPTRQWNAFQDISDKARQLVNPGAPTSAFESVSVPAYMESYGPRWRWADGEVVFRHVFDWPAYAAGKPLFISIGRVDENEMTFLNGHLVGKSRHWLLPRGHIIGESLVRPGENTLALRVWDEGIHGGMAGNPTQLYIRVDGEDPGFYHPDYIDDGVGKGTDPEQWETLHQQRKVADNPYRYYRW